MATIDDPPLKPQWVGHAKRELEGLGMAMMRKREELVNNLSKLSTLDDDISGIRDHLAREHKNIGDE